MTYNTLNDFQIWHIEYAMIPLQEIIALVVFLKSDFLSELTFETT